MELNAQPPRIQVALATGKLVLPEQGCLGQGGCEAKPDYDKVWKRAVMTPIIKVWSRRPNRILIKIRAVTARIFFILGDSSKFRSNFTDKVPFFADLSVSKTYFTDKPAFFNGLSVIFWQL